MRKILMGFYLLIMISFLAACISIPVGDDVLKISSEGIEYISGDDESDDNEGNELSEQNEGLDKQDDESENMEGNEEKIEESTENNDINTGDPVEACEKQDHSEIIDNIDVDFYIPECAILININKDNNGINANLTVEGGNWEDISDDYLDFLGDQMDEERKNIAHESNDIRATLSNEGKLRVTVNQSDEDVQLWFGYDHPKE